MKLDRPFAVSRTFCTAGSARAVLISGALAIAAVKFLTSAAICGSFASAATPVSVSCCASARSAIGLPEEMKAVGGAEDDEPLNSVVRRSAPLVVLAGGENSRF